MALLIHKVSRFQLSIRWELIKLNLKLIHKEKQKSANTIQAQPSA